MHKTQWHVFGGRVEWCLEEGFDERLGGVCLMVERSPWSVSQVSWVLILAHCALCTLSLCAVLILCPSPFCWLGVLAFQSYLRHPPVLTIFVPPICQCPSTTDVPIYINATSSEAFNLAIFNSRSDPSPYIDLQSSCDVLRAIVADQCWDCSLQNCHYGIPLGLRFNFLKYLLYTMLHTLLTRTILCWHRKTSQSFGDFLSLKVVSLFVVICTVHCSVQLYAGHLKLKQLESFMPSLPIYLAIISQVKFAKLNCKHSDLQGT